MFVSKHKRAMGVTVTCSQKSMIITYYFIKNTLQESFVLNQAILKLEIYVNSKK